MKDALKLHYNFKGSHLECIHTLFMALFAAVVTSEPQACIWYQLCLKSVAEVCGTSP